MPDTGSIVGSLFRVLPPEGTPPRRLWSRVEFHRLLDLGVFAEEEDAGSWPCMPRRG